MEKDTSTSPFLTTGPYIKGHHAYCTCPRCYAKAMSAEMKARGNPATVPSELL